MSIDRIATSAHRLHGIPERTRAKPQLEASAGQQVEARRRPRQHRRRPQGQVEHIAREADPLRLGRQIAQGRVGLEHLVLGRADVADLPDVVHDADPVNARFLGALSDLTELEPELGRATIPREVRDVQT